MTICLQLHTSLGEHLPVVTYLLTSRKPHWVGLSVHVLLANLSFHSLYTVYIAKREVAFVSQKSWLN
jgi:hypothetical protein